MTASKLGTDVQTGHIIELPQASRRQGLYIIGANGTGKTGLIENLVMQDINQGLGVGVLDPHGDLTNAILSKMTKRLDDVILLDIAEFNYPFGLNLFTCSDPTNLKLVSEASSKVMHIFNLNAHNMKPIQWQKSRSSWKMRDLEIIWYNSLRSDMSRITG